MDLLPIIAERNRNKPSLDLRFAEDKSFIVDTLNPGGCLVTARRGPDARFSRASGRTFTDSDGLVKWAAENRLRYSEGCDTSNSSGQWALSANSSYMMRVGNTTDPNGGNVATVYRGLASSFSSVEQAAFYMAQGEQYTFSVWAKRVSGIGTSGELLRIDNGGTLSIAASGISTEWQRFSLTTVISSSGSLSVRFLVDALGAGDFAFYGAQLERHSSARTYLPTTSAPVYGPAFEHDPVTGVCLGLSRWEQRTNYILHGGDMTNAAWINFDGATFASDATLPPIVGAIVTRVNFFAAPGSQRYQSITIPAGTATASCWIRSVTGSGLARIAHYDGVSTFSPNLPVSEAWQRVSYTVANNGSASTISICNASDAVARSVLVTGFQFEIGSSPSPYIPTTTAPVVRSADVCDITGSDFAGFYNQSEGTVVATTNTVPPGASEAKVVFSLDNGGYSQRIQSLFYSDRVQAYVADTTEQASMNYVTAISSEMAQGLAWKINDYALSVNGGAILADASATVPIVSKLNFGADAAGAGIINGCIARLTYWPKRLSNQKIKSLTA